MNEQKLSQEQFNELKKSMLMIKTNKNFTYATYTRRWFASVVDFFCVIFFLLFCAMILNRIPDYNNYITNDKIEIITLTLLYQAIFLCSSWKATPGSKLFRIKIVNDKGSSITFKMMLIRILCVNMFLIIFTAPLFYLSFYIMAKLYRNGFLSNLLYAYYLLFALLIPLAMIYVVFSLINKKRTIYDYLSKTHVIISNNQQEQ